MVYSSEIKSYVLWCSEIIAGLLFREIPGKWYLHKITLGGGTAYLIADVDAWGRCLDLDWSHDVNKEETPIAASIGPSK